METIARNEPLIIFQALCISSRFSCAQYTSPIPPAPIWLTIS